MEDINKTERFFKHRRNMLLLSGTFLFLVLSGGTVESVNILGSIVTFSKPVMPVTIAFYCLLYMVIKYVQFLLELNGTGIKSKISDIVSAQVPAIAKRYADKKANRDRGYDVSEYDVIGYEGYFGYKVLERTSGRVEGKTVKKVADAISDSYMLGFKQLWCIYLKAAVHVLITTTWFAEYAMPFLLAVGGIFVFLLSNTSPILWG